MLWDKTGNMRLVLVDEGGMQPIFVQDEQKSAVTKTQMEIKRKKDENPKRKEKKRKEKTKENSGSSSKTLSLHGLLNRCGKGRVEQ